MSFKYSLEAIIIALLSLFIYFFSIDSFTKAYSSFLFVFCLLCVAFLWIYLFAGMENLSTTSVYYKLLIFFSIAAVLLGVGMTGWFSSPYFYIVYCLAFGLSFLFSTLVSFTFVLTIIALLLLRPMIIYDFHSSLAIFSLVLVVPFSHLLMNTHLKMKQKEKSILILKDAIQESEFETKAQKLLHNKVIKFAAILRESLSDIKQLAFLLMKATSTAQLEKEQREIISSVENALQLLKKFERDTTGESTLSNP